jgi:hypothetical protein
MSSSCCFVLASSKAKDRPGLPVDILIDTAVAISERIGRVGRLSASQHLIATRPSARYRDQHTKLWLRGSQNPSPRDGRKAQHTINVALQRLKAPARVPCRNREGWTSHIPMRRKQSITIGKVFLVMLLGEQSVRLGLLPIEQFGVRRRRGPDGRRPTARFGRSSAGRGSSRGRHVAARSEIFDR